MPDETRTLLRLADILGQEVAVARLERILASGRVPHSLIFHGPEHVGKATTALAFAAALLCESGDRGACAGCASCKLLARASHPDLLYVRIQVKTSATERVREKARQGRHDEIAPADLRKVITVDQIREVSRLAGLAPRLGRRRVFIVDPADAMNREAQNALLKTLEEPPGRAALILVAARAHVLVSTVRSRCMSIGFAASRSADLARILVDRGSSRAEALERAALAEGRVGTALTLDLDDRRSRRDEVLQILERLSLPGSLSALPTMASRLAGKSDFDLVGSLDLLETLLRDASRTVLCADDAGLVHADLTLRLAELGRRLGPLRAVSLVGSVERLRGELRFNLNRTLIAESLLAAVAGGPLP